MSLLPEQRPSDPETVEKLRRICLSLPGVSEKLSHGEAAWFVGKRQIANTSDHHHDDRLAFWCAAPPGAQAARVAADPVRYFRPPYVGHRGWIGVYLDVPPVDWQEVEELIADAYTVITRIR